MEIRGAKTIAEYAIRRWLMEQNFAMEYFALTMNGSEGTLEDETGETMILVYDPGKKSVCVKGD